MDVYKRGDEYIVELDVPGVPPDQIEVTPERNVISVRAVLVLRLPLSEASKPRRVSVTGTSETTEVGAPNGAGSDQAEHAATPA
jgi:hypothetical protein